VNTIELASLTIALGGIFIIADTSNAELGGTFIGFTGVSAGLISFFSLKNSTNFSPLKAYTFKFG
jgi:hypothetical protein